MAKAQHTLCLRAPWDAYSAVILCGPTAIPPLPHALLLKGKSRQRSILHAQQPETFPSWDENRRASRMEGKRTKFYLHRTCDSFQNVQNRVTADLWRLPRSQFWPLFSGFWWHFSSPWAGVWIHDEAKWALKRKHGFCTEGLVVSSSKTRRTSFWKRCCKTHSFTCKYILHGILMWPQKHVAENDWHDFLAVCFLLLFLIFYCIRLKTVC